MTTVEGISDASSIKVSSSPFPSPIAPRLDQFLSFLAISPVRSISKCDVLICKINGSARTARYTLLQSLEAQLGADWNSSIAKPSTALSPFRAGSSAFISSSSSKPATALTPSGDGEGQPLSVTGKPRREVPLPSQEKKEGVMQYALYVYPSVTKLPRR